MEKQTDFTPTQADLLIFSSFKKGIEEIKNDKISAIAKINIFFIDQFNDCSKLSEETILHYEELKKYSKECLEEMISCLKKESPVNTGDSWKKTFESFLILSDEIKEYACLYPDWDMLNFDYLFNLNKEILLSLFTNEFISLGEKIFLKKLNECLPKDKNLRRKFLNRDDRKT